MHCDVLGHADNLLSPPSTNHERGQALVQSIPSQVCIRYIRTRRRIVMEMEEHDTGSRPSLPWKWKVCNGVSNDLDKPRELAPVSRGSTRSSELGKTPLAENKWWCLPPWPPRWSTAYPEAPSSCASPASAFSRTHTGPASSVRCCKATPRACLIDQRAPQQAPELSFILLLLIRLPCPLVASPCPFASAVIAIR